MPNAIDARPVPLVARRDLVYQDVTFQQTRYRAVKDPLALKYFHLREEQHLILESLDGTVSVEDLRAKLQQKFPSKNVTKSEIQALLIDLHSKGLVHSHRNGQTKVFQKRVQEGRWKKFRSALLNPLFVKFPGWNPARFLQIAGPVLGKAFSWPGVILVLACFSFSLANLAIQYESLERRLPTFHQFFGWPNIVFLWFTIGLTKVAHELGHAIACFKYRCQCHSIGLAFLVLSPTMYCDASDSWMLPDKWKRICIAAAGMYVEVLMSSIAILMWTVLQPGLLQNLCLNVFFVSAFSTVVFNANPLIKFDGYYILSDFLESPNLKEKSRTVMQRFWVWCCGLASPQNPFLPSRGLFLFGCYAVASTIYGWVILVWISIGLYQMLKPYHLQSIGIAIATLVAIVSLFNALSSMTKAIRTADRQNRSTVRPLISGLCLALALGAILFLPVPLVTEAAFLVEPRNHHVVTVPEEGRIVEIAVREGEVVAEGDLIVRLDDSELAGHILATQSELLQKKSDLEVFNLLGKSEEYAATYDVVQGLESEIAELLNTARSLEVRAPFGGTIYRAEKAKEADIDNATQLTRWQDTPLHAHNCGALLERGAEVCLIAPDDAFDGLLYLEQHHREDLTIDQLVYLKCDAMPQFTFHGKVAAISENAVAFVPSSLSNKYGGSLATTTDSRGREKPDTPVYQVRVAIESLPVHVCELRGRARVLISHRTLWQYLDRLVRRTVLFQL